MGKKHTIKKRGEMWLFDTGKKFYISDKCRITVIPFNSDRERDEWLVRYCKQWGAAEIHWGRPEEYKSEMVFR